MHLQISVLQQESKATLCGRTLQTYETIKPELIVNAVFVANKTTVHSLLPHATWGMPDVSSHPKI